MPKGLMKFDAEDMIVAMKDMIYKFAHLCESNLSTITGNIYELEDYAQRGRLELVTAFEKYDVEKNTMLTTYCHQTLSNTYGRLVRELVAQKRKPDQPLLYINRSVLDNGVDFVGVLKDESADMENCICDEAKDLDEFLLENITEDEAMFLMMAFKKNYKKSKVAEKRILNNAMDLFSEKATASVRELNRSEMAEMLGITRPTLNKRINQSLNKVQNLAERYVVEKQEYGEGM